MSIIISAAILAALVAADLLTKALICPTVIAAGGSMEFIPGLLRFVYLENTGMAFGQLQGFTVLLSIFTALACVAIGYIIVRYRSAMPALINLGLVMILAGALGNLYDRVFRGGVRDFVTFDFFSFPSFNFADSCITVGAVLLAVVLIFSKSGRKFFMSLDDPDGKKNTDKKSGSDGSNKNDGAKDDSVNG